MDQRALDQQAQQQRSFEQHPTQGGEPLQVDPMLEMSADHPASGAQKAFATLAVIAVICVLFYGLNHQRNEEPQQTASAATAETTGAAATTPAPSKSETNPGTPKQSAGQQANQTPQQKANQPATGQQKQQNAAGQSKPAQHPQQQAQQPQAKQSATTTGQGSPKQ